MYHVLMKRITLDLPEDLYEQLRLAAYEERKSVSAIVRERLADSAQAATGQQDDRA